MKTYKEREASRLMAILGHGSKHGSGSKGKHGGPKVDRKQKRIRKAAEHSRRRNRH